MDYKMEELLPVVAELVRKYTSNESTSVTYETAQRLMEAVLYCIAFAQKDVAEDIPTFPDQNRGIWSRILECGAAENDVSGQAQLSDRYRIRQRGQRLPAEEAYRLGYECLIRKIREVQTQYNEMVLSFNAYENENYCDTVTKALPGFFRFYDPRFAPQDTIITMDYPTIVPVGAVAGILAVERYVSAVSIEQQFLSRLPEEYVYEALQSYQRSYRKQFYNITSIVFRRVLGAALVGGVFTGREWPGQFEKLQGWVLGHRREEVKAEMERMLRRLVGEQFRGEEKIYTYFQYDLEDFITELLVTEK